jgi:serine/threonine protein kinase
LRLLPPISPPARTRARALVAQARAMTVLSHPNVTTLFEAGEHEGRVYLAFEFSEGQSLRAEMAGRPLKVQRPSRPRFRSPMRSPTRTANGFVHGGLSPESVAMTQRGHAKIPAFELAAHGGFDSAGARRVRLLDYLAPEEPAVSRPTIVPTSIRWAPSCTRCSRRGAQPEGRAAPSASNRHVPPELDEIRAACGRAESRVRGRSRPPRSPPSCAA